MVHVEEAIRFGTSSDEAHLRLGLVLLDSAAELLMHRQCRGLVERSAISNRALEIHEEAAAQGDTVFAAEQLADIRSRAISPARQKKIDRDFDTKCNFLLQKTVLAPAQVRVLKKLHQYRNETYHRDRVRRATLASAARIYTYLVCTMMRGLHETGVAIRMYSTRDVTPGLARFIDTTTPGPLSLDIQNAIASQLIDEYGIGDTQELGMALAQHIDDRLNDIERMAAGTIDWFREVDKS